VETIFIDNIPYEVKEGQNLLQAVLSLKLDLPYFCWHPALGSVGACRQCAVKLFRDEKDAHGKLVMACMVPALSGTRISIGDAEAHEFRASVTEWMMVNHPHDCPICDEGGECHLQDMVVMTGHAYRRYRGLKRTFRNQDLGPLINHEMNRCIQCYRCVRFYRDYAGGRDFDAFASRDQVYFGRAEDGALENEFSGNLVEVCPTGVFTDKTLKEHFTRKWDLQTAPSICVNCGLGCNIIPGERSGELRRIRNRYNGEVNGYFLCDRGRYGYEFVNCEWRIRQPLGWNNGKDFGPLTKETALQQAARLLSRGARVIGIGSPRASLEANFALRTLVGPEHFYLGLSETEHRLISTMIEILRNGPARSPSLHDVELADAVFVLGEDVTNVAPMLALALRQSVRRKPMEIAAGLRIPEWDAAAVREAVQGEKGPLFLATPYATHLEDVATGTCLAEPDDLARLGFAVAHELNAAAPAVADLSDEVHTLAARIAQALRSAKRPLIISGASCGSEAVIQAAANVAWALCGEGHAAELCFTMPESNSLGLGLMGGGSLADAFKAVRDGNADTVIILENDIYRRADVAATNAFMQAAKHVIVIGYLTNATTSRAELVLPAATFAEDDGTLVNNEGRAQRFLKVFAPQGAIQASWRWVRDMMMAAGRPEAEAWHTLDDIVTALAQALPIFEPVMHIAPLAGFRVEGLKIPRQSYRYSGRTAMTANVSIHEPQPPDDPDSPLAFSMEGFEGEPPSSLIPRFWAPGWNSVQSVNKFQQEIGGPLQGGDPGRRLIEAARIEKPLYFTDMPPAWKPRSDEWLAIPIYHIFGSEELSMLTPGLAERAPQPYVGLGPADAARLHAKEGQELQVELDGAVRGLPIKLMPALPKGLIGLPNGLPGMHNIVMPTWARVMPREGMT
jgi:NADH-quinone oxidoreductase subunit G